MGSFLNKTWEIKYVLIFTRNRINFMIYFLIYSILFTYQLIIIIVVWGSLITKLTLKYLFIQNHYVYTHVSIPKHD